MACARALVEHEDAVLQAEASAHTRHDSHHGKRELGLDPLWAPERARQTVAAFSQAPRFILLDFRCVHARTWHAPAPAPRRGSPLCGGALSRRLPPAHAGEMSAAGPGPWMYCRQSAASASPTDSSTFSI